MKFFIEIKTFFFVLFLCLFCQFSFSQSYSAKSSTSFVRAVDQSDLPDFSQALPMNWCGKDGVARIIIPPTDFPALPEAIFSGMRYPLSIKEHLQFLPDSNLEIIQYFHHDNKLLRNNLCPAWQQWTFDQAGFFHIHLMWFVDTFFVIRSHDAPTCEVIVWIRPQQIPLGRATFFRCAN